VKKNLPDMSATAIEMQALSIANSRATSLLFRSSFVIRYISIGFLYSSIEGGAYQLGKLVIQTGFV
jgi:hypothetical protein